jgi:hypothetical protein
MIPERRSASRAEMKTGRVAAVADMFVDLVFAADRNCFGREPRLRRKGRPAAFLTVVTMANRHADWLAGACGGQLPATAGGGSGHRDAPNDASLEFRLRLLNWANLPMDPEINSG